MVKKSSSHGSSPVNSPTKEPHIEDKPLSKESPGNNATNAEAPPSPGRIRRSLEVATQLCSSNAAVLRERHPQIAAGMDSVGSRTREVLHQLVPETWSPSKLGATVDNWVGDLRIKSATKKSWDVTTELLEKEVEPVVKHLELSVESLGGSIGRLVTSFLIIVNALFKVTSQVADCLWQPLCSQTSSPCSSTTQWEHSWSSVGSSVQDVPVWRKVVSYIVQVAILFIALPLAFVRFIRYRLVFLDSNFMRFNIVSLTSLNTKMKTVASEWFLFLQELFAFFHFMFGCFAVYVFEIMKDYRGPGSTLIQSIPKLLPKSLQSYIVEDTDGQDSSREGDYNAELATREPQQAIRRPNCTS
ncbi:uncharacterized protein Gasu_56770 [Galdieria sulphuraria]|uniref:Uncharacterized protein n=1 Tax=Galdieria sulphuraria TaxID=130081 RepID=M2XSK8_GALSU|nr:uncharacterized protein Gasu_56770 [Galdieria sulphuraria]EME26668.1 hypothetical protein Gasu_56770 [Galdieria sulphuraria]|eukprot:XP_005703188.1 hypothetical protein Gasu_56770 [Galdieria sulphuraria]